MQYDFDDVVPRGRPSIKVLDVACEVAEEEQRLTSEMRHYIARFNRALKKERERQEFIFKVDGVAKHLNLPDYSRHVEFSVFDKADLVARIEAS